jgi:CBS domain-containing protein
MSFDRLLHTLGHSRYDRLPVVDDNGELVGVVQYADVAHVLLDPALRSLIVARDIATQEHFVLKPSDTLQKALGELKAHPDHTYLLVVDDENPQKLVGVVRHNDVLSAQRRLKRH